MNQAAAMVPSSKKQRPSEEFDEWLGSASERAFPEAVTLVCKAGLKDNQISNQERLGCNFDMPNTWPHISKAIHAQEQYMSGHNFAWLTSYTSRNASCMACSVTLVYWIDVI